MTDYRDKLTKLAAQPRWKRTLFTLGVNALLLYKHLRDFYLYLNFHFPRRRFTLRRIQRAHYIGYPRQKPHRAAFILLAVILFTGAIAPADSLTRLVWVIGWGVILSSWVTSQSWLLILKAAKQTKGVNRQLHG